MNRIVVSLVLILLICIGVGFTLHELLGSFWRGFVGALICHFFFILIAGSLKRKNSQAAELEEILDAMLELQTADITCPCGKLTLTEPIFINKDNIFKCDKCGNDFRVDISFESVLQTNQPDLNTIYNSLQRKGTSL